MKLEIYRHETETAETEYALCAAHVKAARDEGLLLQVMTGFSCVDGARAAMGVRHGTKCQASLLGITGGPQHRQ